MIRPLAFALACSLALPVVAGPAAAQEPPRPAPKLETLPDTLGRAAIEALMQALGQALSQVPQYGARRSSRCLKFARVGVCRK